MPRMHCLVPAIVAAVSLLTPAARAETRVWVDLAGRDDTIPKLGMPGIAVHVQGFAASPRSAVAAEVADELKRVVHTRPLGDGEAGDYDLEILLEAPRPQGPVVTVPFAAELRSRGERVWRITGRSEVRDEPVDAATFASIGRNVVAALAHDGWVQPRYDPDNPPPAAPAVRIHPDR
ncbi:MAG TPA: hypothetical protein VFB67_10785 [Candidatus Polarisedimenticolaceae bacterium]|nr:hypothetical protein [Candidatus Polarisedimenticolaceae bacterium]